MRRPNHLILKPIFAVLILRQTFPDGPYPSDWHDYDELAKIWAKVKKQIKTRDFLTSLEKFDVRSVREKDIVLIKEMYEGDIWMSAEMIDRHKGIKTESAFSLAMWRWVNKILEFVKISEKLDKIGIVEVEAKIDQLKTFKQSLTELLCAKSKNGQHRVFKRLKAN